MDESEITPEEQSQALITEEHVKAALKEDKGSDADLKSWKIEFFTKKGDNYVSRVMSVLVDYTQGGSNHQKSYVVKLNPCRDTENFMDVWRIVFYKEIRFFKEVASQLSAELVKKGLSPIRFPEYIYSSLETDKELMFMEDLRDKGFRMFDRKKGLDPIHTTLILQELARLHAASLLLKHSGDEEKVKIMEKIVSEEWITSDYDFSKRVFDGIIDNAKKLLENVDGYERAIEWLEKIKPKVVDVIINDLRKNDSFVVLCHGDCWNNNVLFRYDENGVPVEVMLLDLQIARLASPATDLSYLMYTSIDGPVRRSNLDFYLDTYHDALKETTQAGGLSVPFTRQQLQEEFKDKRLYGVLLALMLVPMIVGNEEQVPDMDNIKGDVVDNLVGNQSEKMVDMLDSNPLFRPRFLALFDEMMECGVIPKNP